MTMWEVKKKKKPTTFKLGFKQSVFLHPYITAKMTGHFGHFFNLSQMKSPLVENQAWKFSAPKNDSVKIMERFRKSDGKKICMQPEVTALVGLMWLGKGLF